MYQLSPYVAELYDAQVTHNHDAAWIVSVLARHGCRTVLEVGCGTGRVSLPVAQAGHVVTGVDSSAHMLERFRQRMVREPSVRRRVQLYPIDFHDYRSVKHFDCVLMVGNCLHSQGGPRDQRRAVALAASLIRPGGLVILDGDVHETLPESWGEVGRTVSCFPEGVCADGTEVKSTACPTVIDRAGRFLRAKRSLQIHRGGALVQEFEWIQETHTLSVLEMESMIQAAGLTILEAYAGTEKLEPIHRDADQATYVATR